MEIDIDIDDIIMSCSKREKKDLYKALLEDGDVLSEKEKIQKDRELEQHLEECKRNNVTDTQISEWAHRLMRDRYGMKLHG
jgi:hypothetical protein